MNGYSGIDSQIKKDIKKNIKKYAYKLIEKNNKPPTPEPPMPEPPLPSNLRNSPLTPPPAQPEINQVGIKNIEECMKMILKDIKKSKEYKDLPKNIGKSKLKKNKLCKAISKN